MKKYFILLGVLLFSIFTFGCESTEADNCSLEDIKSACEEAGYTFVMINMTDYIKKAMRYYKYGCQ